MSQRYERAKYYTEKYKDLLQPCQYCGNTEIEIVSDRLMFENKNAWSVCCTTDKCDSTGAYTSVRKAIEVWNSHKKK